MNLETKVDDLREILARVENKLDEIIKKQNSNFQPKSLDRFKKSKSKYEEILDEIEQECIELIEWKKPGFQKLSFRGCSL